MPKFKVEVDFLFRANNPDEAARSAFDIMAADRTLPIKVAEIISGAMQKRSVSMTRADVDGQDAGEAPQRTQGNSIFKAESSFHVTADDLNAAARSAFHMMATEPSLKIGVAEKVSGVIYKPSSLFTREEAFESEAESGLRL